MSKETIVLGAGRGVSMLCVAAALASAGHPVLSLDMLPTPRRPPPVREITQQDRERIAAAEAKRARKAEKRRKV